MKEHCVRVAVRMMSVVSCESFGYCGIADFFFDAEVCHWLRDCLAKEFSADMMSERSDHQAALRVVAKEIDGSFRFAVVMSFRDLLVK